MQGARGSGEALAVGGEPGRHASCLNCGAALLGDYCHACGQQAHLHRTLGAFWHDLLHGVLHFEGKMWRTLPLLAWRPGDLTRRYIEGQRARFVSPLAMFLCSVFLMFAVIGSIGGYAYRDRNTTAGKEEPRLLGDSPFDSLPVLQDELKNERKENRQELADLAQAREKLIRASKSSREIDARIASLRQEATLEERVFQQALQALEAENRRNVASKRPAGKFGIRASRSPSAAYRAGFDLVNRNPDLTFYKVQTNAYKFSWALIPLLIPFVSLLFLHRRRYRRFKLYDHAVFVTYALTFTSLFAIAYTILKLTGLRGPWALLPFVILPVHTYRHLKQAYALSRFGAIWRTAALSIFTLLCGFVFFLILLISGAGV